MNRDLIELYVITNFGVEGERRWDGRGMTRAEKREAKALLARMEKEPHRVLVNRGDGWIPGDQYLEEERSRKGE